MHEKALLLAALAALVVGLAWAWWKGKLNKVLPAALQRKLPAPPVSTFAPGYHAWQSPGFCRTTDNSSAGAV